LVSFIIAIVVVWSLIDLPFFLRGFLRDYNCQRSGGCLSFEEGQRRMMIEFNELVRQSEEKQRLIEEEKLMKEKQALAEAEEILQTGIKTKELSDGFGMLGQVLDYALTDLKNSGGYIKVKSNINSRGHYMIYHPSMDNKSYDCLSRIDTDLNIGDWIEIRGNLLTKVNGLETHLSPITICDNENGYIKKNGAIGTFYPLR